MCFSAYSKWATPPPAGGRGRGQMGEPTNLNLRKSPQVGPYYSPFFLLADGRANLTWNLQDSTQVGAPTASLFLGQRDCFPIWNLQGLLPHSVYFAFFPLADGWVNQVWVAGKHEGWSSYPYLACPPWQTGG